MRVKQPAPLLFELLEGRLDPLDLACAVRAGILRPPPEKNYWKPKIPWSRKLKRGRKWIDLLVNIFRLQRCEVCWKRPQANYKSAVLAGELLCEECATLPRYQLITQTTAAKDYRLNRDDLDALHCLERPNPHYRSGWPMRLFLVRDVEQLAARKHGGLDQLKAKKEKAMQRAEKRKQLLLDQETARKEQIIDELAKWGCKLRDDSHLCSEFIHRGIGDPVLIAQEMAYMRYLHNHTRYPAEVKRLVREFAQDAEGFYAGIRSEASEAAKELFPPPEHWPWLPGIPAVVPGINTAM